jgi:penicillin-binding protein 1A
MANGNWQTRARELLGRMGSRARRMGSRAAPILRSPWVWGTVLVLGAGGIGFAWGSWQNLCADCPSVAQIHTWEPQQASRVYAFDGRVITELGMERRTPVSIDALPPHVHQAFVAVEDRRFYEHPGYDVRGISRAVVVRMVPRSMIRALTGRTLRSGGGSTITQQLARNMFEAIGFERRGVAGYLRKLKELQVSLELERAYSKDRILEAYMNQINLGPGWWGIQTASRNYFGKDAVELNPAEGALLAAIANLPGHYSPFTNPENALSRRNLVLNRMVGEGFLSQGEAREWMEHPLPTSRAEAPRGNAPYFSEWVRQTVQARFGEQVYSGGLRIYTTLDLDMQRAAETAMERGFDRIESRPGFDHPKYEEFADQRSQFQGATSPYLQGLLVALDPETGAVRALVGGRDFQHSQFNRVTQAHRQAGSSFKAFVYAAALSSGIPPSHIVNDGPVVREQLGDTIEWRPRNFSGTFDGDMTIRDGFRRSINMVAIKLADEEVGLESVVQTARRLGIRTPIPRVPSIAIGAADVLPIQMAEAYTAFATLGTKVRPYPIVRVENAEGEVLWEHEPERTRVFDPLTARLMLNLMEHVVSGGTAYNGVRVVAELPFEVPAAGKTGTTNNATDVWFVGATPNLQATVWFGMDSPRRIYPGATGGGDASPVWGEFMRLVYYGDEEEANGDGAGAEPILPIPAPWPLEGLVRLEVDNRTGLLASRWCPEERRYTEYFIPGTEPTEPCDESGPGTRTPRWPWR